MPVYMGGSHRTTDMSQTANKRGGQEGRKGELQGKMKEGESKRRREGIAMVGISAKILMDMN